MHSPDLVGVEIHLRVVLHLSTQILAPCGVANFLQPATDRLYPDLNLQVLRNRAALRWIQNHEKGSRSDVGMSPQRDDAGPYPLAFDDRKRRPVVRVARGAGTHSRSAAARNPDQGVFIRALSREKRSTHIHRLKDQPQRRAPYQYADRRPGSESPM